MWKHEVILTQKCHFFPSVEPTKLFKKTSKLKDISWVTCPVHFLENPEQLCLLFLTASRFALFSVVAHPSCSHNSQSVSENFVPLLVVDQVLESL